MRRETQHPELGAVIYHDMLCHQFLLTLELQRSTEERIERLAREKERLGYDYSFAVRKAEDLAANMLMASTWQRTSEPRGCEAQALPPRSEPMSPARSGSCSIEMWQQLWANQVQLRSGTTVDEGGTPVDPHGGDDSFSVAPPPASPRRLRRRVVAGGAGAT